VRIRCRKRIDRLISVRVMNVVFVLDRDLHNYRASRSGLWLGPASCPLSLTKAAQIASTAKPERLDWSLPSARPGHLAAPVVSVGGLGLKAVLGHLVKLKGAFFGVT
jgi:hypothetical protein